MDARSFSRWILTVLMLFGIAGCEKQTENSIGNRGSTPRIGAVSYPLASFAKMIAGTDAEIVYPVPQDVDPAYWTPDDASLRLYQDCDLILCNGAGYAKWLDRVSLRARALVDTSSAFSSKLIKLDQGVAHRHGDGETHTHGEVAFTTWLDLKQAAAQVRGAWEALRPFAPDEKTEARWASNHRYLQEQLGVLDTEMDRICRQFKGTVVFSHPVYAYWQRRYGMTGESLHWEPDMQWTPEAASEIQTLKPTLLIWEGEPNQEVRDALRALGVRSTVLDPCAVTPDQGDFLTAMRENIERLRVDSQPTGY